jgi:uncharacterized protein (TIGR02453 family)
MTIPATQAARAGFSRKAFDFLTDLQANNNRDWFNAHKQIYQTHLEAPFAQLLEDLTEQLEHSSFPMRGSKATMFRMNRDTRFSNDKLPYKTSVSGLLTPSGTKSEQSTLIYLQLDLDGGFVAGGLYQPDAPRLYRIRHRILEKEAEFETALAALDRAKLTLDTSHSLVKMPRDFTAYQDHSLAWALKLKSLIVKDTLSKTAWTTGKVLDRTNALAKASAELMKFLI